MCCFIAHVKAVAPECAISDCSCCDKDTKCTENVVRQGCEECNFSGIKITELKNFHCNL